MSDGYFIPVKRESPDKRQHLHTLEGGAWLPFSQAVISGVIIFCGVLILAVVLRGRDPLRWAGACGALALIITWLSVARHWFSLTALEKLETLTGQDLNHDGYIGEPPAVDPKRVVTVQMVNAERNHFWTVELPATPEQMEALATGLLNNNTLSELNWCGKGHPFSLQQFRDLRSEMISRGLVHQINDKDTRQGYDLTAVGRELMRLYASPSPVEPIR